MIEEPSEFEEPQVSMYRVDCQGKIREAESGKVVEVVSPPVSSAGSVQGLRPDRPPVAPSSRVVDGRVGDGRLGDGRQVDGRMGDAPQNAAPGPAARRTSGDAISQSMILLATMTVMLLGARYVVPGIVEEIRYAWHRGELRAEYETGNEGLKNVSLDTLSQAYQMVTSVVGPSVVHIDVQRREGGAGAWGRNAAGNKESVAPGGMFYPSADQGSGIIIDAEGFILTNRHVIADGDQITVTLSDGRRCQAAIVGTDTLTDLAVLKVTADKLIPIVWGDSDDCRVGSPVWAVGSPFGLDRTVTFGILSGKHRMVRASTQYQDFMQSDVAVNPGNSGGPLVDSRGTLVGVNTAIVGDTYQGVSFSIPSNVAKGIYERLRDGGRVERAWLGVALSEVPEDQLVGENARLRGALVSGLAGTESPASRAGIQSGDVIVTMQGKSVRDVSHLMQLIGDADAGAEVTLGIQRNHGAMTLDVRLDARPASMDR